MTEAKPGTLFVKSSLITVKRLQVLALILQMGKQKTFSIFSPASLSLEVERPVLCCSLWGRTESDMTEVT